MIYKNNTYNLQFELPEGCTIFAEESFSKTELKNSYLFNFVKDEIYYNAGIEVLQEEVSLEDATKEGFKTMQKLAKNEQMKCLKPEFGKLLVDEKSGVKQYVFFVKNDVNKLIQIYFVFEGVLFLFNAKLTDVYEISKENLLTDDVTKTLISIIKSMKAL